MQKSIRSHRGFTLIEVLIVITLIVVLASMGMASYTNSVQRSREAVLQEDLFRMRDAIDQYYADKNKYPQTLQDLVTDKYLREIPKDPITNSAEPGPRFPRNWTPTTRRRNRASTTSRADRKARRSTARDYADWD